MVKPRSMRSRLLRHRQSTSPFLPTSLAGKTRILSQALETCCDLTLTLDECSPPFSFERLSVKMEAERTCIPILAYTWLTTNQAEQTGLTIISRSPKQGICAELWSIQPSYLCSRRSRAAPTHCGFR